MNAPRSFTVEISSHALLRYMERVRGIDVDSYRKEFLERIRPAAEAGASRVLMDGLVWVIDTGKVVTVHRPSVRKPKKAPKGRPRKTVSLESLL